MNKIFTRFCNSVAVSDSAKWIGVDKVYTPVIIGGIQKAYNGNNDVSCFSSSDGEISKSAWGGTDRLQYAIDGTTFQVSNTFKGLAAGKYNVTNRDANGCTATKSITLTTPAPVTGIISSQTNVQCASNKTGSVTITGKGGVRLYYYSIDGSAFQWMGTFKNLAAEVHPEPWQAWKLFPKIEIIV